MTSPKQTSNEGPGDPAAGLFGPASVTWRLHADPVLWVAGLRALFLQALHPEAMAVVAAHSDFRRDWWGRLTRTAAYVATVTYGTTAEAHAAAAAVRRRHAAIRGTHPDTGRPYQADDPELLLWVHCCLVDSVLVTCRRGGLPLTDADADRYVAEQVRAAELVGLPAEQVPRDTTELAAYLARIRPQLRATPAARAAFGRLVLPPLPGPLTVGPVRVGWAVVAGCALALLPRWARRCYGLPGLPVTDLLGAAAVRGLRVALLGVPPRLREGPHLRAARSRMTAA